MDSSLEILNPGFFTTIQDGGRSGYAHLGVPESGVMDKGAFQLANALLNNDTNDAVLECTLVGPKIQINADTQFVITGANASASLDRKIVRQGVPLLAKANQILTLSKITEGSRCYVAFAGGLKSQVVMGSRSWYKPITTQAFLIKGMTFPIGVSHFGSLKGAHLKTARFETNEVIIPTIEVYRGPEFSKLTKAQQSSLLCTTYTVSNLWNRMAIQLVETIENSLKSIHTSPVIPGTVQLTPSGKLIVLMNDCQTTGGYPRILQLSKSALNLLAQMQQGDQFLLTIA